VEQRRRYAHDVTISCASLFRISRVPVEKLTFAQPLSHFFRLCVGPPVGLSAAIVSHAFCMPYPSHTPSFDDFNNIWRRTQITKLPTGTSCPPSTRKNRFTPTQSDIQLESWFCVAHFVPHILLRSSVVRSKSADVSEEHVTHIFWIEE
jgi:hypothetical protein